MDNKSEFFKEGQEYVFFVTGKAKLPPDDEEFFILKSTNGSRHLLKTEFYQDYRIEEGAELTCRVDKINCSGRIYLEPRHPYYETGNDYPFVVNALREIENSEGKTELMAEMLDAFGNTVLIPAGAAKPGDQLMCRVSRIKKGRLYLLLPDERPTLIPHAGEQIVSVTIAGLETRARGEEFYKVRDASGRISFLRKKYYESYGFKNGMLIQCRIISEAPALGIYLEPVHPFYYPGMKEVFTFSRLAEIPDVDGKNQYRIFVSGYDGREHTMYCPESDPLSMNAGDRFMCLVRDIRQSKLILECIEKITA